jgi:glycerophosphoryl diester phosphodiesterase
VSLPRLAVGTFLRTGHRGARGLAPENTLAAFQRGVAEGVDVLELDVGLSADDEVVVMHDDTVDRTTDWRARHEAPGEVAQLSFAELSELDAGYHFTPDGGSTFPYRGQGVTVPRLVDVLESFPEHLFTVELKGAPQPHYIPKVIETVRPFAEQVVLASFSQEILKRVRELAPDLRTSFSAREIRNFYLLSRVGLACLSRAPGVVFQAPLFSNYDEGRGLRLVDRRFLRAAHKRGVPVTAWTINDPGEMRRLIDEGVDGITTDRPDVLNAVLAGSPVPA